MRNVQILATGVAVPSRLVTSKDIDLKMGHKEGFTEKLTGVKSRYYSDTETATDLACAAIHQAIENSHLTSSNDIDCIISASGTVEQAVPYNAAIIHSQLKLTHSTPAFDVNMTCLSALMAFDLASNMLSLGQYKTVLVVSSEIASVGIDWQNLETGGLFGDGAAAVILSLTENKQQGVIVSHFETFSEGVDLCVVKGGGTRFHPTKIEGDYNAYGLFEMKGKEVYKLASKYFTSFINNLFEKTSLTLDNIDWVVPHQASKKAMNYLHKSLNIRKDKIINILSLRGNQIAASIPSTLHELLTEYPIKKGDKILLVGTSAGLSIGAMIIEY